MKGKFPYFINRGIIVLFLMLITACGTVTSVTPTTALIPPTQEEVIPTATSTTSPTTNPQLPPIKVKYPGFTIDGKPFRFIGANSIYFGFYDEYGFRIEDAIRTAKESGINVLRIYIGFGINSWNGKPYEKFDEVLDIAAKYGVYVIATITDCCCFGGDWGKTNEAYFQHVPYCDVANATSLTSFKDYIKKVLFRKNSVNGIIYKDDTTIMAWDVANEQPLQLFSDSGFKNWLTDITAYIKSLDPNHLITIGIDMSRDVYSSAGAPYEALNVPGLDFYSFHFNLPNYRAAASNLDSLRYRTEMLLSKGKPVVLEEFGVGSERVLIKGVDTTVEGAWLKAYRDQMDIAFSSGVSGVMFWGWGVPETRSVPLWWNTEDHDITETKFVNLIKDYQIPPANIAPNSSEIINTPLPTDLPVKEVYVKAFCTIIGLEKTTHVPAGSPVTLVWGWSAKTESQIDDFLESNITTITFDGKVIEGSRYGGIRKVETRDIFEVLWVAPLGILSPGEHIITYDGKFDEKIEDGTSSYGPGTENEFVHDECLILVE
jgi:hypothetical protein